MVSWDSDAVLFSFCPDDLSFGESEIPQLSVTVSWGCKAREGTYVRLASDLFSLLSLKLPSESEDL